MCVGTVRERKDSENRVALAPEAVYALVSAGSEVIVEASAGVGAGYSDAAYAAVGGTVVADASTVWSTADLVIKVKEPVPAEYDHLVPRDPRPTLFTYLHLAADRPLTERLMASGWTALAYELVARPDGSLPLLAPMSQVAGHMAADIGTGLLKQPGPGKGKLLGEITGVAAGKVVILGSRTVATAAVRVLLRSEARIVVMSRDLARLSYLQEHFGGRITTRTSSPQSVTDELEDAELLILAVLVPGATGLLDRDRTAPDLVRLRRPVHGLRQRARYPRPLVRAEAGAARNGRRCAPARGATPARQLSGGVGDPPSRANATSAASSASTLPT